jgi:orotidine-5'-phosphate decarboxylase
MMTTEVPDEVRDRMVLGLDVGGLAQAEAVAKRVAPWFDLVKIGHELYAEAGPMAFERFHELGFRVFCDLKLHDIPNTVERARALRGRVHEYSAAGGETMLRVRRGAHAVRPTSRTAAVTLAVTVLTSEPGRERSRSASPCLHVVTALSAARGRRRRRSRTAHDGAGVSSVVTIRTTKPGSHTGRRDRAK